MTRTRLAALSAHTFALAAQMSLRPDKTEVVDNVPPAVKSHCFIKYFDDGDAGVGISGSGVQITDGKKAIKERGGIDYSHFSSKASGSAGVGFEQTREIGRGVRSKQVGIDGKAPLAPLAMAHATAMKVHFGAGLLRAS